MSLLEAYRSTHYTSDIGITLLIGKANPVLDSLLKGKGLHEAAYITAWNPLSKEFTPSQNDERNKELLAELSAVYGAENVINGSGEDPAGEWPGEDSFLVLGTSIEFMHQLAIKYGQNAYVYYRMNGVAELITTPLFKGD